MALLGAALFGCGTDRSRVIRLWHCQEKSNSVVALPEADLFACDTAKSRVIRLLDC